MWNVSLNPSYSTLPPTWQPFCFVSSGFISACDLSRSWQNAATTSGNNHLHAPNFPPLRFLLRASVKLWLPQPPSVPGTLSAMRPHKKKPKKKEYSLLPPLPPQLPLRARRPRAPALERTGRCGNVRGVTPCVPHDDLGNHFW